MDEKLKLIIATLYVKGNLPSPHRGPLGVHPGSETPIASSLAMKHPFFFQNKDTLNCAIQQFEQWTSKPQAEIDVKPRRTPPSRLLSRDLI